MGVSNTVGTFFPSRINMHFPRAKYSSDVGYGGAGKISLGPAPIALNATGILNAASIATALDTMTFATTYKKSAMGRFGRNVTVVASGAATSAVSVYGTDYLGQPMKEDFTLNGATPVVGKKAFTTITRVSAGITAGTTINVGWGNVFGLPYKIIDLYTEMVDNVEATAAGTITLPVTVDQTATTGDPRGSYTPNAANVPNGVRTYQLYGLWDNSDLYGKAQYAG